MASITRSAGRALRAALSALDTLVRVHAHVLFSRSRVVGVLLILAAATHPTVFAHGVLAVVIASVTARMLGLEEHAIREGSYGYNALLVGLGVAYSFAEGPATIAMAAAAAVACTVLTAALSSLFTRVASLPVLSVPFVLVSWMLVGAGPLAGLEPAQYGLPLLEPMAPEPLAGVLRGLGSLFFVSEEPAGALVLLALLVHSRIGALLASGAVAMALVVVGWAGAAGPSLQTGLMLNGALTAVAIGGVWFVPSLSSFLLAGCASVLSATLMLGLFGPLQRTGLPVLILPFNLAMGLMLCATRQRLQDRHPKSVDFTPGSPEENLAYFLSRVARFDAPYLIPFRLPFRGTWTCTQGEDGAHTHQGAWRHAFDFEVCDQDRSPFRGEGATLEDHHCFRLPVLAAADGVVARVVNDVNDNVVGRLDLKQNWGNVVLVYHAPGLYSLAAHLAKGSVKVYEGQHVRRGDVLGLCGSSGRSPRPHLHFQLQGSPELGAATLPCRFSESVVVTEPGGEALNRAASTLVPLEGSQLRNVEPDAELAACFALEPGGVLVMKMGNRIEHLEHELDLYGNLVLRSREHGARLYFFRSGDGFMVVDATGSSRSAVHLLRAALSRVLFDASSSLSWTDLMPARWASGTLVRVLRDFVAPFFPSAGVEMVYRTRRDEDRFLIEGSSKSLRRGLPRVRTVAALSPTLGLLHVELKAHGRTLRAERVIPPSVARIPDPAPQSPRSTLPPSAHSQDVRLPQSQGDTP